MCRFIRGCWQAKFTQAVDVGCVLPYVGGANLKTLVDLLSMYEGKTGPISEQYLATPAPGHSIGNALRDRRRLQYLQPPTEEATASMTSNQHVPWHGQQENQLVLSV